MAASNQRKLALDTRSIQKYYDKNTQLFLYLSATKHTRSIHRSLWPPGISELDAALNVSNELVHREIKQLIREHSFTELNLIDLGCGVGESLRYHLQRLSLPVRAVGLTISQLQARLASKFTQLSGLSNSCLILAADYHYLPVRSGIHLAYSIEAFVHSTDPGMYFRNIADRLAPGGRLVLIDDFKVVKERDINPKQTRFLDAYQNGWHIPRLLSVEETIRLAGVAGLLVVNHNDLTGWLRLRPLPDTIAALVLRIGGLVSGLHQIIPSMLGSVALQQCLKAGLISYRQLVFERTK